MGSPGEVGEHTEDYKDEQKHVQYLHGRVEQDSYDAQELRICFDQTMRRSIRS